MADFKSEVEVSVLDKQLIDLETKLQSLENRKIPIDIQLNQQSIASQISQIVNGINLNLGGLGKQMQQAGAQSGKQFSSAFSNSIDLRNGMAQISNLQSTLKSMNFKSDAISVITKDLENLKVHITDVKSELSGNGKDLKVTVSGLDDAKRAVTIVKSFNTETGKANPRDFVRFQQTFEDLDKLSQKAKTYGSELENLKTKFKSVLEIGANNTNPYTNKFKEMVDSIDFSNITSSADLDMMVEKLKMAEAEGQRLNSLMSKKWASNAIEQINKNLTELPGAITIIEEKFKSLGTLGDSFNGSTIRDTIASLRTDMQSINNIDNPETKIAQYNQIVQVLDQLKAKILETQATQRNLFSETDVEVMRGKLSGLERDFEALGESGKTYVQDVQKLKTELDNLGQSNGSEQQVEKFNHISDSIVRLGGNLADMRAQAQTAAQNLALVSGKSILGNQIQAWMNKNTKATKAYANQLSELKTKLEQVDSQSGLKQVSLEFRNLKTLAASEGNLGKGIFSTIASNLTKISPLFGMSAMITKSIQGVKEMWSTVVDLDTSLVDLQKTTTASYDQLNDFYYEANEIAKEYGTTTKEIIQSAADFSRLGFNIDDSEIMSKYASMFKSISPGMDIEKSTTGLVSVMKAYGIEAQDVLDGVMSKINIVGRVKIACR